MQIILYDNDLWRVKLFPLALTRPVSNLRVGILTIDEKWSKYFNVPVSFVTEDYLAEKYPLSNVSDNTVLIIRGNILPDEHLCESLRSLKAGEALVSQDEIIAFKTDVADAGTVSSFHIKDLDKKSIKLVHYQESIDRIDYPEDIFKNNGEEIKKDFELLTKGRVSAPLSTTNQVFGDYPIFLEEGVNAEFATFNTSRGPVYLGKSSQVWEGSHIRGPFALGEESTIKMGARIYSNVTIGPYCTVGGELNTSVIWGNSNKGHDGYMGNSVVGEWCNWGADTNNSNMKNNFKDVRLYDYEKKNYRETGLQFCGVIMGDYVRCAINTAFNTGTVVGVSVSIFDVGVPPTFIPDFSWGSKGSFTCYEIEKMFQTSELLFQRRSCKFDEIEKKLLKSVFDLTKNYRNY
ncbi:putative sugar nucleotidyl transferase [Albibacterium bauzanense]|uniref:UDP-N-acetylglucosamine diphosphorylase/glucosamine-1-phosphate N-acetyltransferase n=1 Tax=Albibacterium bauzanense TaxID=653929 RepID=A0A4R1M048_9SPHI|nr:putative sugar nucleotidyl transferase [Albibacterium bauzanense]TCK85238.1 UDP-N-acetylglucosamine diphosphorylase/glucosamine-1-phosphate N-acetyltransferase [Albibacterium bauzanense]